MNNIGRKECVVLAGVMTVIMVIIKHNMAQPQSNLPLDMMELKVMILLKAHLIEVDNLCMGETLQSEKINITTSDE